MLSKDHKLDVVNCTDSIDRIRESEVYRCPVEKGSKYDKHKPAKYLGIYKDKTVTHIAEVIAVVDVMYNSKNQLCWTNDFDKYFLEKLDLKKITEGIKNLAEERLEVHGDKLEEYKGSKVFLLGKLFETNFTNPNVPWPGHNTIFDISGLNVSNTEELAIALNGKSWDDVPKASETEKKLKKCS